MGENVSFKFSYSLSLIMIPSGILFFKYFRKSYILENIINLIQKGTVYSVSEVIGLLEEGKPIRNILVKGETY